MLVDIWARSERLILRLLCLSWFAALIVFLHWWFNIAHIGTIGGFILTSLLILWTVILQGYCFFFVFRMKRPHPDNPLPDNKRVAMIITKTPHEPLSIAKKTLLGMIAQKYPHDTWVADEDPTPEALAWYENHNIKISCRKENPYYHQDTWPRRKKTKEGNLAYFHDNFGYHIYDFVVQMDVDHIPEPEYLEHMLRPFSDPKIGYVAAASVCDNNSASSWAARARAYSESVFHGPIQSGANDKWVPICIGSHYAIRTEALKEIGGLGPELAEDYSTTLLMNAHGWKGVWTYAAEAHGNGPESFADIMIQDYQWSRSLVTLFLSFYFKFWFRLSWRQRLQYTFTMLWYPMNALRWFIALFLPLQALSTGKAPVDVSFIEFIIYASLPLCFSLLTCLYLKTKGYLRPWDVKLASWENTLFELARWPWVLLASIDAVVSLVVVKKAPVNLVTPKDKSTSQNLTMEILLPYFVIILINSSALIILSDIISKEVIGYFWFIAVVLFSYVLLVVSVMALHTFENKNINLNKIFYKPELKKI